MERWMILIAIVSVLCLLFWWLIHDKNKRTANWEKLTDPKNATQMTHHGFTHDRGEFIVVVSPFKWVMVRWDKPENKIDIYTRPETWREESKITKTALNWKVKERPPEKVGLEYFVRQVM
jgi:hypothetical protein